MRFGSRTILSIWLAALLLAPGLLAATDSADRPQVLEEVEVRDTPVTLEELRQEMIRVEDRFYARYNELNRNDLFDIHCADMVRTGTRLTGRYCRAVYEERAFEKEGREHLWALQFQAGPPPKEWIPPTPAIVAIERRRKDFRQAMIDATRRHPELLDLLKERAALAEQYEQSRRNQFGLEPREQQP